jgi:putative transposase
VAIKALRMQIIKPYNEPQEENSVTWDTLGKTFRDLRYAASKMANYVIQQNYIWEFFRQTYKMEHGQYPSASENKDKLYCYPVLTKMFPMAAGQLVNQIEQHAKKVWNTRKSEVLKLHQSLPSFKLNFPIIVHRESYSINTIPDANNKSHVFILKANLTSKITDRTTYAFLVDAGEKSKRSIVERIMSGDYRQGALQIVSDKKGKWYCIIPYEFAIEKNPELDPNKIMGIDLGISRAVYWAFNDSYKRGSIDGKEIEEFRRRVQARRKSIQEQGKYCGEGRIGHGRKRRLQPIETLQDKEANFRDTTNHRYAKHIVEVAVKNQCGVIQMEDLTGINELSTFLKNWTYHDLQTKIKQKATEAGITVNVINPQFTSQRCSQCGYIDKNNRPSQAVFICNSCGYGDLYHCFSCGKSQKESGVCNNCSATTKHMPVNADYNAAKNIATPNIETIIADAINATEGGEKKTTKKQGSANL